MTSEDQTVIDLYSDYEPPKGSSQFFSLEDGKSARVRIQSDPYVFQTTFKRIDGTKSISTRYAWLIYNFDEKQPQALKMSGTFFSSLAALIKNPEYGDPTQYDIHIARTGTGTDTIYTVNGARKNLELDNDALTAIASMDLREMAKEDTIMTLRSFIQAGKRFDSHLDADGTPKVKDLD